MNKKNAGSYEAPMAVDLSVAGVDGAGPLGVCSDGSTPYTNCKTGLARSNTICMSGTSGFAPDCSPGAGVNTQPSCTGGSNALVGCIAGSRAP